MIRFIKYCFLGLLVLQMTACVDQEFDTPPGRVVQTEDISNTTIKELKDIHELGQSVAIPAGTIIKGRVISDDTQGNFFREIIIQDETAGILIRVDKSPLFTEFERGRIVYVDCDGLNIGDFAGLIQIGFPGTGANIDRIPEIFVDEHLIAGELPSTPVAPVVVRIDQLNDAFLSTLVQLDSVQFQENDLGESIAVPNGGGSTNRNVEDCDDESIVLRSSDFSDFAGFALPMGRGNLTAIYSKFNTTKQLTVRDPQDIDMSGPRCDDDGGGGTDMDISNATIADMLELRVPGTSTALPADMIIKGIVISDDTQGNFFKELIIQDATAGILVRVDAFDLNQDYEVGKEVFVRVGGLSIGDFGGLPQIGIGNGDNVDRIPEGSVGNYIVEGLFKGQVTPTVVNIADINESHINTLLQINDIEFSDSELNNTLAEVDGGSSQNRNMNDCDAGFIILRTSDFSEFAGADVPDGNGRLVGVYGVFNSDKQMKIRDLNDLSMTGPRCDNGGGGTDVEANTSIAELLATHTIGSGTTSTIAAGTIIEGIVTSDDSDGNFFKELIMEDESGGILIRLDANGLGNTYSRGDRVFVKCDGLSIGDFGGVSQIGIGNGDNIDRIPEGAISTYLVDGGFEGQVTPTSVSIEDLNASHVNRLIAIDGIEFADSELNSTIAIAGNGGSQNKTLQDCDNNTVIIRTSDFSDFATAIVPDGNGRIVAIYGVFNADMQLKIRDLNDLNMNGPRCDGGGTGGGDAISIASLRSMFEGGSSSAPNGFIEGKVISDYTTESVTGRNLHIQDETGGIVIRFTEVHSIPLGATLKVNVGGTELSEFNGLLQLNDVLPSQVESSTNGADATPVLVTLADINSNLEALESTLVIIENVTLSGSSTFDGALTVTDATGSLTMFTRGDAVFAGSAVPSGPVNITAIVTQFNDAQILIRSLDDIN